MMTKTIIKSFLVLSCALLFLSACSVTRSSPTNLTTTRANNSGPFSSTFDSSSSYTTSRTVNYTNRFSRGSQRRDGATLHAVIVADTNDDSIGASVGIDLKKLEDFVNEVARHTGLSLSGGSISGNDFSKATILAAINSLSIGPNDVVWFYNSSHGYNPGPTQWPAIYTKDGSLPLTEVADLLKAKRPRFSVVIADVCNGTARSGGFMRARVDGRPDNYKELFLNYAGNILASSSKNGQYSWGNSRTGGLFTTAFLGELENELRVVDQKPNWKTLMERAIRPVQAPEPQHPQAEVNVRQTGSEEGWEPPPDCNRQPGLPECQPVPGCAPGTCPGDKKSSPFSKPF
jgi:hypothetical protein